MQKTRDRPKQKKVKKPFSLKKSLESLKQKLKNLKSKKTKAPKKPKPKAKKVSFKESFNSFKAKMKNAFKVKIPKKEKTVTPKKQNTSKSGKVDFTKAISGVFVILAFVAIIGIFGNMGGTRTIVKYKDNVVKNDNVEFNIAYGDTAPTDTSKLWIKTSKPKAVNVTSNVVVGNEELEEGVGALPSGAHSIGTAAVGTKIYLFGGAKGDPTDPSIVLSSINVFDTETNTTTTLSVTLPSAAYGIGAAAVGTKIYLFGGYTGSSYLSTINVFNTETNAIETLSATLPAAYQSMSAVAVGTKIYLFGGRGKSLTDFIIVFDTETNTIETLSATLPTSSFCIGAVAVGTKIYLFGGGNSTTSSINTISVFDTETYNIETLSEKLPTASFGVGAAAVGTKIYLFGGGVGYSYANVSSTINVFDTETNTIETLSATLPTASFCIGATAVGTKIYLFGGYSSIALINVLNVYIELATNNMLIEASNISQNLFNLLPGVEFGIKAVYRGNSDGYAEKVPAFIYKDGEWVEI